MTELDATVRALLDELAAGDRGCRRFGASRHRYRLAPPAHVAGLPEDYRRFVGEVGAGGAGPFYGLVDVGAAIRARFDGPWGSGIPIAHAGCGYAIVLALDDGRIWISARAIGVVEAIYPSFTAYYVSWLDRLARNQLPDAHVPPGRCALANALGGYLGACEQRLGLAPGAIAGDALRDALGALGPGAIAIAADRAEPLFSDGEPVDPCLACACLVDNLGLAAEVVAPGLAPKPER